MLVVEVAGLLIAEDFVGLRDGFEFLVGFFALLVGDFVRVGCEGGLEGTISLDHGDSSIEGSVFTLWYAFLISALVAERWMFRTSMIVSEFEPCECANELRYRRGRFPRPYLLSPCGVDGLKLSGCIVLTSQVRKWKVARKAIALSVSSEP
jgi:hypothetical protein